MSQRMKLEQVEPELYRKVVQLDTAVASSGLDHKLFELIKIYASQLNGCAFCVDMHTRDAREAGESERRLHHLAVWRESPLFDAAERAALAMTEAVTLIAGRPFPEEVYRELLKHHGQENTARIIMAIVTINAWNRIAISTGKQPDA